MKVSLIVPLYKQSKELERLFWKFDEQTSKNFEVIFVVDTNRDRVLEKFDELLPKVLISKNVKLIYNSNRVGRHNAIDQGIKIASGDYVMFLSAMDRFEKDMVASIEKILESTSADIIEFNLSIKSPIKFEAKVKNIKETVLRENISILPYIQPVDFNKLYKLTVLQKSLSYTLPINVNSRFSFEHVFMALMSSNTYASVPVDIVRNHSSSSWYNFNPMKMLRQIKAIESFIKNNLKIYLQDEFTYVKMNAIFSFIWPLMLELKSKQLILKFNQELKKIIEENDNFLVANKYILSKEKSAQQLSASIKKFKHGKK